MTYQAWITCEETTGVKTGWKKKCESKEKKYNVTLHRQEGQHLDQLVLQRAQTRWKHLTGWSCNDTKINDIQCSWASTSLNLKKLLLLSKQPLSLFDFFWKILHESRICFELWMFMEMPCYYYFIKREFQLYQWEQNHGYRESKSMFGNECRYWLKLSRITFIYHACRADKNTCVLIIYATTHSRKLTLNAATEPVLGLLNPSLPFARTLSWIWTANAESFTIQYSKHILRPQESEPRLFIFTDDTPSASWAPGSRCYRRGWRASPRRPCRRSPGP